MGLLGLVCKCRQDAQVELGTVNTSNNEPVTGIDAPHLLSSANKRHRAEWGVEEVGSTCKHDGSWYVLWPLIA